MPMMTTNRVKRRKSTADGGGVSLSADACPQCGTTLTERRGRLQLPVNGDEIRVPHAAHLKCPRCREVVLTAEQARRLGEDAIGLYRNKHGLLSADEIRATRQRFGLTQRDMARLLRLGANTISRWEAERNVQTGAMDVLLRVIRDVPGSVAYLRRSAA